MFFAFHHFSVVKHPSNFEALDYISTHCHPFNICCNTMGNSTGGTNFSKHYKSGKSIGSGTFATVKQCTRITDSKIFAVKIIKKEKLSNTMATKLQEEIKILTILKSHDHPHIIKMEDIFENENKVKMVLELCEPRDLLERIYSAKDHRLDEKKCAEITHTIASTLQYLHDNKIVHRDLKPENILFSKKTGKLKIADFGCAKMKDKKTKTKSVKEPINYNNISPQLSNTSPTASPKSSFSLSSKQSSWAMNTTIGTPLYLAPEVLISNVTYSHTVDIWSLGVILYLCLCGQHPFTNDKSMLSMYGDIMRGNYSFPSSLWNDIDPDAIDLVKGLLCVDVSKRITCHQILEHKWILKHVKKYVD